MCGIFGGIGKYDVDKLKLIALLNEKRGEQASGMFDGKYLVKGAFPISRFLTHRKLNIRRPQFVFGHARFATSGGFKDENAHPFTYGNIVGAHNGMVYNFDRLKQKEMIVDSEVIFWGLDQHGTQFLQQLEAYWGLVWYDKREPDLLHIMRHDCELAIAEERESIYFSSDAKHLQCADLKPKELKENVIYSINIHSLSITQQKVKNLKKLTAKTHWSCGGDFNTSPQHQSNLFGMEDSDIGTCQICGQWQYACDLDRDGVCIDCMNWGPTNGNI